MEQNIDVSIIFVNYKNIDLIVDAVKSVKENTSNLNYEMIVEDNSCDSSIIEGLKNKLPSEVIINDTGSNLGFGRANNLGANISKGKYLLFLNTDTLLVNNAIYEMYDFLEKNNNASVVGPNIYTKDNLPNHSFIKCEKNMKFEKKSYSVSYAIKRKLGFKKKNEFNYKNNPLKINGYICGACLMIRRDDFLKLNGFDNDIFMYAEESLLCRRVIKELNKDIYNVPSAKIIHLEGGTFVGVNSVDRCKRLFDGNYIYYTKCFGKDLANIYLKKVLKWVKRKGFVAKLLHLSSIKDSCNNMSIALKEKIKEVGE